MLRISLSITLDKKQRQQLAGFCLDISKLAIGSLVLGAFTPQFGALQMVMLVIGLTIGAIFLTIGLRLFKQDI